MRRFCVWTTLTLAALSGLPGARAGPTVGGIVTGPVEYVDTLPLEGGGAASARIVDDYLYLANYHHISIYDISDPLDPQLQSISPVGFNPFSMEDIDTNGKILIFPEESRRILHVWDVRDKTRPVAVAQLAGAGDHMLTCVLDCKWVYGSSPGHSIVDLRDPASPKLVGEWDKIYPASFTHDVTEVAPGCIVTASRPTVYFLDVGEDPRKPRLLATAPVAEQLPLEGGREILSSTRWPRRTKDRFLLIAGETPLSGPCNDRSAAFTTWDARGWRKTRSFTLIDELRMDNGTYADGNPPANVVGCSSSFFEEHPSYKNGGLVAASWFEHGTRFLKVDPTGKIGEVGSFLPYGGLTLSSFWVDDEIVYAIDQNRGIDILRYVGRS
ncbi:MAG: LVIVD repeat-containing protein [Actinomycetota bacterium]